MKYIIYVKDSTTRFPEKNIFLLPYTLNYLKRLHVPKEDIILTGDCIRAFDYANLTAGLQGSCFFQRFDTLMPQAIENVREQFPDEDCIVMLPCTPFREHDLLDEVTKYVKGIRNKITTVFAMTPGRPHLPLTPCPTFSLFGVPAKVPFVFDEMHPYEPVFQNPECGLVIKYPFQVPIAMDETFSICFDKRSIMAPAPSSFSRKFFIDINNVKQ